MINNFKKNTCQDGIGNVIDKATIALCLAISLMSGDASCMNNKNHTGSTKPHSKLQNCADLRKIMDEESSAILPATPLEISANLPQLQPAYGYDKPHWKNKYFAEPQDIAAFGKALYPTLYPSAKLNTFVLAHKGKLASKSTMSNADVWTYGSDIILDIYNEKNAVEKAKKELANGCSFSFSFDNESYYFVGFKKFLVYYESCEAWSCVSCLFYLKQLPEETGE